MPMKSARAKDLKELTLSKKKVEYLEYGGVLTQKIQFNLFHLLMLMIILTVFCWSGVAPKDRPTWILEVSPVLVALILMTMTFQRFPLTPLLYFLIMLHCVILCVGGKYTYAEVPLGYWFQEVGGFSRNHYDRLGHLAQGFVPAILAREIFLRKKIVNGKIWVFIFAVSVCLAFSAFYEMLEWWTALATGEAATAFLGTQGDVWDTQWDMFCALVGAVSAQLILSTWHDSQLKKYKMIL